MLADNGVQCMSWDELRPVLGRTLEGPRPPPANTIFRYLAFNPKDRWDRYSRKQAKTMKKKQRARDEGYLRHPEDHRCIYHDGYDSDVKESVPDRASMLYKHPIAKRSFAAFPPLNRMRILFFSSGSPLIDAFNSDGVTVWDIHYAWIN